MASTEILQFAGGVGANVLDQADYAALTAILANGYSSGIAQSSVINKTLRQSNFIAVGIATWLVNRGISVPDDGSIVSLVSEIEAGLNARLNKSVAEGSDVTLDGVVEANYPIITLSGVLTGNINVIVPTLPGQWIMQNATTGGAYTITVKTAAGTGRLLPRGTAEVLVCDGTNVVSTGSAFVPLLGATMQGALALFGGDTGVTPDQFDNDTSLATTAFVKRALGGLRGIDGKATAGSLALADVGKLVEINAAVAMTLPAASTVPSGEGFYLHSVADGASVVRAGADVIYTGNGINAITTRALNSGERLWLVSNGADAWYIAGGSAALIYAAGFAASLANSGYQKLPSGLIIQWGSGTYAGTGSGGTVVTLPVAFPSTFRALIVTKADNTGGSASGIMIDNSTLRVVPEVAGACFWIAIGD